MRWAVPAGVLAITGGSMAAALIPVAQAAPALPAKSAAQLLADVAARSQVPAFSGTVLETTSLGLPQLPGAQRNPTSITSLLTGSHTIQVWYASARQYRAAFPGKMSETDLYRDGSTAWLWQSVPDTVTKFTLPAKADTSMPDTKLPVTPQQAANDALAAVGPTTTVSVDSNVYVAGRAAYELVLAPKDSRSLVGQVRIAIDASNSVPLRAEVFARHATSPAISIGFQSVTFATPPASDLTFTPPPGAKVTSQTLTRDHGSGKGSGDVATTGSGWLTVLKLPATALTGAPGASGDAPVSMNGGPGEEQAAIQAFLGSASTVSGSFGTGQLIKTSLVDVLIANGSMYVGAVEPSVLYAAAAQH
jgi:outer membrane lipoprotein-sorting protein